MAPKRFRPIVAGSAAPRGTIPGRTPRRQTAFPRAHHRPVPPPGVGADPGPPPPGRSRGHQARPRVRFTAPSLLDLSSCGVSSGPRPVACDRPWSRGRPSETDPLHATNARRHRRRLSPRSQPPRRGSARDCPGRRDDHSPTARMSIFRRVRPEVRPDRCMGTGRAGR